MTDGNGTNGTGLNGHSVPLAARKDEAQWSEPPYDLKFCGDLLEWVNADTTQRVIFRENNGKYGKSIEWKYLAGDFPSFEGFASKIGVRMETLDTWQSAHPEFKEAMSRAAVRQKHWVMQVATKGLCPPPWAIFMAKNISDMMDKPPPKTKAQSKPKVIKFEPFSKRIAEPSNGSDRRTN